MSLCRCVPVSVSVCVCLCEYVYIQRRTQHPKWNMPWRSGSLVSYLWRPWGRSGCARSQDWRVCAVALVLGGMHAKTI